MRRGRSFLPTLAASVVLGGCATVDPSAPTPEPNRRVAITGPAIIGYFPAVTDAELNSDDGLASALEHLQMALDKCVACFGSQGVSVQTVFADKIAVVDDGHVREIDPKREPAGIGAFLVSPGRAGRIVHAGPGPSSLIANVPSAAADYFHLPSCNSPQARDAP